MEHQYPGAISGDENMLAELMLPDQVHNRKEDWTIFFLHKDTTEEEEPVEEGSSEKKEDGVEGEGATGVQEDNSGADGEVSTIETDGGEEQDYAEGEEGPPLIYVLNLVNTKHDKSVKRFVPTCGHFTSSSDTSSRGAVVKAMAICTRHPFLHIYKVRNEFSKSLVWNVVGHLS